ncbi:MAG: hypothetical protein EOM34_03800 [Clostridia bacterium]|nr:hypothetical protein [Lachnospiraceae bacterium]NCB99789.1 hypothetical protein [Clostridia bacterium]NCD01936.1 hypothetical protein [Clostridia bacterium]
MLDKHDLEMIEKIVEKVIEEKDLSSRADMEEIRISLKTDIEEVKTAVKENKDSIEELQMTIENDVYKRISIIAEGHLDLSRKLDDALKVENEKEILLLRVTGLENDMRWVKKRLEEIA